ncbi:MAG: DUF937 domain-containing protein [Oscillospiraceae bacterium]|nr:DUF937 domain-containing protein [Oscillospiraceae bacterium]
MTDVKKLLNNDILREISREADGDIDAEDVAKVLNAVMPQLEDSIKSGELAKRGADVQRGGVMDLLPLLLGGSSTSAVAQSTGVNSNSVNSILKIAAPILLYMLLKDDKPQQTQQQSGGLNLLGALLGGQQQAQPQQNAGLNLLGALLGGQQQAQPQQQNNGLLSLFGDQPQQTQQQNSGPDLLGTLFSILGDTGK